MIRSMTGFGRRDLEIEGVALSVEVRSVNHRHLDLSVRLPRSFAALEGPLRSQLQGCFGRGRVDVTIAFAPNASLRARLVLDRELAEQYRAFASELSGWAEDPLSADSLMALPGVARLVEEQIPLEAALPALEQALAEAAEEVIAMREREGEALHRDLSERLGTVWALVESFAKRSEEVIQAARVRLRKRVEQLREEVGEVDEARLHQELVAAADRLDVNEELVRLRSHVEQFREVLQRDGSEPCGRRLDFLLQEMMREANTVGSKASDASLAHLVVDLKTELERIREQVQNLE